MVPMIVRMRSSGVGKLPLLNTLMGESIQLTSSIPVCQHDGELNSASLAEKRARLGKQRRFYRSAKFALGLKRKE